MAAQSHSKRRAPQAKRKKPEVRFIRVSRSLELTRSPVDGMWRAWGKVPSALFTPMNLVDKDDERSLLYYPERWVVVASARKAKDAIEQARELGFR